MVKKTKTQRVWARQREIVQQKKQQESAQEQGQNSISSQSHSQNDEQLDSLDNHSQTIQSQNHQLAPSQQQIPAKNAQNIKGGFFITTDLISKLTEQVYKNIVLTQFIQTNHSYHKLREERQHLMKENLLYSQTAVKQSERQRITQFVSEKSLGFPSYYKQFESGSIQNDKIQPKRTQQCANLSSSTTCKFSKRNQLSYLNTVLFDVLNIKFLNIYGPTGSGKTYMLKSIFKNHSLQENIIWLNGMNILKGKTKRFLADIKNKLDSLLWENCINKNFKSKQSQCQSIKFSSNILTRQNEKILVVDEYDQASHFSISDLLRYAYIKQLQSERRNVQSKSFQMFFISKVILVSNTFSTQINNHTGKQQDNVSISKKTIYVQNLIFRPFCEKQAQKILIEKINKVNMKFLDYLGKQLTIKSIFQGNSQGVFSQQRLLIMIRKICFGDQVDIRKILFIVTDSVKILTEILQQKLQQNQKKPIKKFNNFLIDDKFLLTIINGNKPMIHEVEETPKVQKPQQTVQDDENPLIYYVFNLENEGKSILTAIHKQLVWKIKCERELKKNQTEQKTKANDKINLQSTNKITQKTSTKKQSTIKVQNFYKKIRPRVQFTKLFHWLYEYQQVGLIRIRKDMSSYSHFDCPANLISQLAKIRIMDNYEIEVLDKLSIEKGLQIY